MLTNPLRAQVYEKVAEVPRGRITTYGDIAKSIGLPTYSRHVGVALRSLPSAKLIPWWRVVNSQGKVSFRPRDRREGGSIQKRRLEAEGVVFRTSGTIANWTNLLHEFE